MARKRPEEVPQEQAPLPGFKVERISIDEQLRVHGPHFDESAIVDERGEVRSGAEARRQLRPITRVRVDLP